MTSRSTQCRLKMLISVFSFLLAYTEDSVAVGVARIGSDTQQIICSTMRQLLSVDLGKPLHSLVIPAPNIHFLERDMLRQFALDPKVLDSVCDEK